MSENITTIKLGRNTVGLLNKLKVHHRQSYEEVILKFIAEHKNAKKTPHELKQQSGSGVITTIKLAKKTAGILNKLKIHPRQSYEEIVLKLIPRKIKTTNEK